MVDGRRKGLIDWNDPRDRGWVIRTTALLLSVLAMATLYHLSW